MRQSNSVAADRSDEARALLIARARTGLWLISSAIALFALLDATLPWELMGRLLALKVVLVVTVVAAFRYLRRHHAQRAVVFAALVVLGVVCAMTVASGLLLHDVEATVVLCIALCWGTAALLPWGPGAQMVMVFIVSAGMLIDAYLVRGIPAIGYPTAAVLVVLSVSAYLARELERQRRELARENLERTRAENALRRAHQGLERRVEERTAALRESNDALCGEVARRERAEVEMRRVHRALRTLSEANQVLVRAADEVTLLQNICRVIVEVGGYRFAWVGFAEQDPEKTVRPVGWAGHEEGFLAQSVITWADTERGRGPVGTAIRTGERCTVKNVQPDSDAIGWRREAFERGYLSILAVPLRHLTQAFGALAIYAAEEAAFGSEEVQLLTELAGDLAYGISVLRARAEQRKLEGQKAALLDIATDLSGTLDRAEILDRVQRRTAGALPCDGVATFYQEPDQSTVRMIGHYGLPAALVPEAERLAFPAGEPFGGVLSAGHPLVINDTRDQPWLSPEFCAHFGIAALVAVPLRAHNRDCGALVAFNAKPGSAFDAAQVELCAGIGRQLAVAIEGVELFHTQQEEAEISAALARVAQELIAALDTPAFLNRLCRVTAEVLGCDSSHTLLWRPDEDGFTSVAANGSTPEQQAIAAAMNVPRDMMAALLAQLERDDVAQVGTIPPDLLAIPAQLGVTLSLAMALRRGSQLIGVQIALSNARRTPFTDIQRRIARGIAHVGSVALEHARVVEELARANRLKSEFVATMSHELRTPLNIIMGYTTLLQDGAFGSLAAEQVDTLQRVERSAGELLGLINATLDLSRLDTGQLPLDLRSTSVPDLISETDVETREWRRKPGVTMEWRLAPELPVLRTDAAKLKIILKNLINNGIKFTEQGSVSIDAHPHDGGVEFTVHDTGIGIEPAALPIIFEPFRQADGSNTRQFGGVGLGLYIVRRLLDLMEGTIAVESAVGQGSTFRVWIPPTIRRGERSALQRFA